MPNVSKQRPIFNTSEFGVREGLLTEKAQFKKMGGLILKSILGQSGIQASFIVKGREEV